MDVAELLLRTVVDPEPIDVSCSFDEEIEKVVEGEEEKVEEFGKRTFPFP